MLEIIRWMPSRCWIFVGAFDVDRMNQSGMFLQRIANTHLEEIGRRLKEKMKVETDVLWWRLLVGRNSGAHFSR